MWHTENCHLVNGWVIIDCALNFSAINIFAGTQNHVFDTVFYINKTIGIKTANIA